MKSKKIKSNNRKQLKKDHEKTQGKLKRMRREKREDAVKGY